MILSILIACTFHIRIGKFLGYHFANEDVFKMANFHQILLQSWGEFCYDHSSIKCFNEVDK